MSIDVSTGSVTAGQESPGAPDAAALGGCCRSRRAVIGGGLLGAAALTLAACSAEPTPAAVPSASGTGTPVLKAADLAVGAQANAKLNKLDLILFRQDEKTVLAYSAICTHAGCTVQPGDSADTSHENEFHCPCHDSYFNVADGSVAGGPAPRPLTRYAAEIKGEDVVVYS